MSSTYDDLVLGIDAGGTKTSAWLAQGDQTANPLILGKGASGPGNPRAVGFAITFERIQSAIAAAFEMAGLVRQPVRSICMCLAGAGRAEEQQQIQSWSRQQRLGEHVRVTGDADPVLAVASPEHWGVVLISGTGSFSWGRNRKGIVTRAGGWGYLFGDEGSAYALAISGLRAAAQAADGRGPSTELLPAILEHLEAVQPSDLIQRIYGSGMARERVAELAEIVFSVAPRDAVAANIVKAATDELAGMIATIARILQLPEGRYPLGLAGGVLTHQPEFRRSILQRVGLPEEFAKVVEEPVFGAVLLAIRSVT